MTFVIRVHNRISGLRKDFFINHNDMESLNEEGFKKALIAQDVYLDDCDVELDIIASIKQFFKSDQMSDHDVLDLAALYLKANKAGISSAQLCALMSKSKNKKIRKVGEYVVNNPQFQINKLEFFSFPNYAKEIFDRIEKTDAVAAKRILETLIAILELKRATTKRVNGLMRYPKIMFGLLTIVFIIFCFYVIPNIASAIKAMGSGIKISSISQSVYEMSAWGVDNKIAFSIQVCFWAYISYKIVYFILKHTVVYIPFIYKIGFYRDHALFFGLLGTFQSAGIGMIESFLNATEVISNPKDKKKMRLIVQEMITQSQDFGDGLEKHQYNKELAEHIIANRGLSDLETYDELKTEYTDEMKDRVDTAAEYVEPASKFFIFGCILVLAIVVFGPMFSLLTKLAG
jgi:type II secretion system protein F domain protein